MKQVVMRRRGEEVVIQFDYAKPLVAAVKGLGSRSFDPVSKEWSIPAHLYMDAKARLEAAGGTVELDTELESMFRRGEAPSRKSPQVYVTRQGNDLMVRFEYDPVLVETVKGIQGRSFDPVSKAWFIPYGGRETLRAVVEVLEAANCAVEMDSELRRKAVLSTP